MLCLYRETGTGKKKGEKKSIPRQLVQGFSVQAVCSFSWWKADSLLLLLVSRQAAACCCHLDHHRHGIIPWLICIIPGFVLTLRDGGRVLGYRHPAKSPTAAAHRLDWIRDWEALKARYTGPTLVAVLEFWGPFARLDREQEDRSLLGTPAEFQSR